MRRRVVPPFSWPRVVGAWALLLPGVIAFQPAFGGVSGYLASFVGVTLGAGIALAAVGLGWSLALWVLALLGGYVLVGGPLVLPESTVLGVLPSLETLRELALLIPFGWRDLLTAATPAGDFAGPAAVPLLAGLVAGTVTVGIARGTRAVFLPLLVPLAWLAFAIAFGVRTAPTAVWLGAALGAGLLAWVTAHRLAAHRSASAQFLVRTETGLSRETVKIVAAGLVIALAGGVAVAVNQLAEPRVNRQVLRDDVVPPLTLHEYPSPLTKYRLYELTEKDEVLFRVEGMPEGARLRLAVMDTFDGNVFTVSPDAGQFVRSGRELPFAGEGEVRETRVTAVGYDDVWLPTSGAATWLSFDGDLARPRAKGLHVNRATGQALTTARFADGGRLDTRARPIVPHTEDERAGFADAGVGTAPLAQVSQAPDVLVGLATDWTEEATSAYEQLSIISERLRGEGFYSDGSDGTSRSGHNRERLTSMFTASQWIGDDEQIATAMALMAHQLGIPVRVVLGFHPLDGPAPGDVWEVTGTEAHVWVEANLDRVGWVAFDPTPDRDKVPQTEVPQPKPKPKPQVDPPPNPPERLPDEPVIADEDAADVDEEDESESSLLRLLLIAGAVVGGAAVVSLPFLLILALKARRATRRRTRGTAADQVSGAWDEIVDRARDLGYRAPSTVTRREAAVGLQESYPAVPVVPLAADIDAAVFGPVAPDERHRDAAWEAVPGTTKALLAQVPWYRRLPALVSLRSLRRRPTEAELATRRWKKDPS